MNPFGDMLRIYAERNPKGVSIYYGTDRKETWKELNDRVNSLANALSDIGVKKDDKGIVMFHNCPEFIESVCALQKLGAIPCPMNYRFVPREIEYQTNLSDSKVFLMEDLWLENVRKARPNMPKVENYIVLNNPEERMLDYEGLIKEYPSREPDVEVGVEDPCLISFTGGTTGMPKGVVLTYNGFIKEMEGTITTTLKVLPTLKLPKMRLPILFGSTIGEIIGSDITNNFLHRPIIQKMLSDPNFSKIILNRVLPLIRGRLHLEFKFLLPGPLFHLGTFGMVPLIFIPTGIFPLVLPVSTKFNPEEVVDLIDRLKISAVVMSPTMYSKVLDSSNIDKCGGSSVFLLVIGMATGSKKLKGRIFEKFPNAIMLDAFGQTEMHPATTIKIDSAAQVGKIRDKSVGVAVSGVEIRIVNERGEDVKPGETGELIYRGPTMMKGYYGDINKTSEAIKDGWFYSGDLGYLDEDGEVHIVERKTETINVGGEKIYPHEVEEILGSNSKVEHACLIGILDETYGKIPRAVIQLKEGEEATEEEMIDFCRGKMAGFKRPKSVVFVEDIPLNPVGKALRREVEKKYGGK